MEEVDYYKYQSSEKDQGPWLEYKSRLYWLKLIINNTKMVQKIPLTKSELILSTLKQQFYVTGHG